MTPETLRNQYTKETRQLAEYATLSGFKDGYVIWLEARHISLIAALERELDAAELGRRSVRKDDIRSIIESHKEQP